ncbi:MAG TPA: hypothetical protein VFF52_03020 [Isosphaeraceae bacterium]|nr:hypothetical protein [Isosphaeraceae bacterium]
MAQEGATGWGGGPAAATAGSSYRVEIVEPAAFAEPASRILQDAFQPPCLRYTPDYLRWLFRFPNGLESIGVAAFDGAEPVGFFAVMPRWMRSGDRRLAVSLMSSLAVRPGRGGPLALALYSRLLELLRELGRPVVSYVRPGTVAERLLLWNFARAGLQARPLGSYRTYGALNAAGPADPPARVEEGDEDAFLEVVRSCRDERMLWRDPDRDQLRHYGADPRGCVLAVIRDASGGLIGAATVVLARVVLPQGDELIPMINSVHLPRPTAEALQALIQFARRRWDGQATAPVVTAPNLIGIDPAVLRAAGLRATPSAFQGYVFDPIADSLPAALMGTNLEVV